MVRLVKTFTKAQFAAGVGTAADFAIFAALVKVIGLAAVWGVSLSATVGAIINFQFARHWVFRARHGHLPRQAVLFGVGAGISIFLNTGAVLGLTLIGIGDFAARVVAAGLVAVAFNFPFQRYVVFGRAIRKREEGDVGDLKGG